MALFFFTLSMKLSCNTGKKKCALSLTHTANGIETFRACPRKFPRKINLLSAPQFTLEQQMKNVITHPHITV